MFLAHIKKSPRFLQLWGTFLVLLSGTLYGFIGFLGTEILRDRFSVLDMLFWRFFIASIWILIFSFFIRDKSLLTSFKLSGLINVLFLSSIFYSSSTAFYFLASKDTGTGPAMVIFFSFPVFVVLFAWLTYKERISKIAMSALAAIIIGLYLLKGRGGSSLNINGIFFGIASALFYAFYIVSSKRHVIKFSPNLLTILICLGNALIFLILAYLTHTLTHPTHLHTWIYVMLLGIFATAVPIQLLFIGLKYISPIKASILTVTEPVMTLIVGMLLLGETISLIQMTGVFIILLGATLIQFE
ncbi:MAG: DMT family transporter [Gammaproteobacteria bacterium]